MPRRIAPAPTEKLPRTRTRTRTRQFTGNDVRATAPPMNEPEAIDWLRIRGVPDPPAARMLLRAGPLTLEFDPALAFVRYVRLGGREAVRAVYSAIRDPAWETVAPRVSDLRIERGPESFDVAFTVDCLAPPIHFRWRGRLTG